ncbi:MAG: hypothetical protein ARM1_0284 [Candidatus Micrarchaeota archaeon]|nr:MAG: hypothetical protein ARM1_0284 [Candidatus Micrarchaeota archaeon]
MAIKYWEFEDAALREKIKNPSVAVIARLFYDNETEAYRFAAILKSIKKRGSARLKDIATDNKDIPLATIKRYLDFGINIGLIKYEDKYYSFTERFLTTFKNITLYIKAWLSSSNEEDLDLLFPNAKKGKRDTNNDKSGSGGI